MPSGDKRRKSLSGRRHTDFPLPRDERGDYDSSPVNTHIVPASRGFEGPLSKLHGKYSSRSSNGIIKQEEVEDEYSLEPGEEFAPEEAEELAMTERKSGSVARRSRGRIQSAAGTSMLWVIVIALLSGYFAWWRKEKMEVGYCDYGKYGI